MSTTPTKSKSGFTIIEVVLVLAIAGLIFMMVFLALPALQRSQRDTQRTNDISRLMSQLENFKSNNRGRIPTCASGTSCLLAINESTGKVDGTSVSTGQWGYFYNNYLLAGGDTFEDPSGGPYTLDVSKCGDMAVGVNCSKQLISADGSEAGDFDAQYDGTTSHGFKLVVQTYSTCSGETAVKTNSARNVSVLYKKEGGGIICQSS